MDAQNPLAPPERRVAAAILAGGGAVRLGGRAKGGLIVGGRPILDRQLEALQPVFSRVFVVANTPGPWAAIGLQVVGDRVGPGAGPLAGVDAALAALRADEDAVVCVGCDMPFLLDRALMRLRDAPPEAIAVTPRIDGHAEPLFSRYGRQAAAPIAEALAGGERGVHRVLERLPTLWIDGPAWRALDPELAFLLNVNTPEDLERAEALAARGL